ncbi:MAG: UDP-N-acetylmuramate--L-alanine ligase, partial [Firmicutes bacterium]|nr:UDP-N-acetylmuramate--L-alanine ligase [Bacillota bacterium]
MDISKFNTIHFIGIGGISMSSLAEILLNEGKTISGSDSKASELTERLKKCGIKVYIGQCAENIRPEYDLIVYTAAISADNPELIAAKQSGAAVIDRAALVGMMMLTYKYPVSVAGTHGKTTTSSILSEIFMAAGKDPTISLGGILPSIGGNFRIGGREFFLLETCEYQDSFLKFNPHSAIILNVDKDHTDYFTDLEHIYRSFNTFAKRLPQGGTLVVNSDIKDIEKVTNGVSAKIVTYGREGDWTAENIGFDAAGFGSYSAYYKGEKQADIQLSIPGMHNVYNSLAAFALAKVYGLETKDIVKGIDNYKGVDRRFQRKGAFDGVAVVDDYAHHPTEIAATISSARAGHIKNLWIAFQPHTYTRTHDLLDEFANALSKADDVVILDIYAAREKDTGLVHSRDLVDKINALGGAKAHYLPDFESAEEYLSHTCKKGDML